MVKTTERVIITVVRKESIVVYFLSILRGHFYSTYWVYFMVYIVLVI